MPAKLTDGPRIGHDLARVGAGVARGENRAKKLNAAAWSGTWPAPGSTLDLDFANNRGWVRGVGQGGVMDAITFTRASIGRFVGSDGKLYPEQDSLKNLVFSSNNFDATAWGRGAPVVQLEPNIADAPAGLSSSSRLVTSATGSFSTFIAQGAKPVSFLSQTFTASVYIKSNTGSNQSVYLGISLSGVADYGTTVTATTAWTRVSFTQAIGTTGTALSTRIAANGSGSAVDILIAGYQLEIGGTATDYEQTAPANLNAPRFDWASTAQLPRNLQIYSQQFGNSAWRKNNVTVTSDVDTAPDGTTTADLITAATGFCYFDNFPTDYNINANATVTFSIYAKRPASAPSSTITISYSGSATATFNTGTGEISGIAASGYLNSTATDVGSGWWRFSITFRKLNPAQYVVCSILPSTNLLVWGGQYEFSESPSSYLEVQALTPTNTPLAAASTCNGLLIEEARTNRILWCRDATQSNWTKTNVTAAKDQTGIDGVASAASSLTATADNGTCIQTITLASGSRTGSVYLKRITGTGTVQVSLDGSTWSTVELSLTEWRRVVLSGTVTNPVVGVRLATNGDAVAMDYAQVEDGAFQTTPIPTTSATVTRAQETAFIEGANFNSWYKNGFGTAYCEFFLPPNGAAVFALSAQDNVNYSGAYRDSATSLRAITAFQNNIANSVVTVGLSSSIPYKMAYRMQAQDFEASFSSFGRAASFAQRMPSNYVRCYVGGYYNGTSQTNNCIKRFAYIPQPVAGDGLQNMTGPQT